MRDEEKSKAQLVEELNELRAHLIQLQTDDPEQTTADVADGLVPAGVLANIRALGGCFTCVSENAADLIYRYRFLPEPGFDFVSPSAKSITGYTPDEHYNDPELDMKLVHPEDRPLLEKFLQGEFDPATPLTMRWVRKSGDIIWTEHRITPRYNDENQLVSIEGVARDITALKEAELELRQSLEYSEYIAASIPGMVYQFKLDPEGNSSLPYLSQGCLQLSGVKPEDGMANANLLMDRVHPDDNELLMAAIQQSLETLQVYDIEHRIIHADGRLVWLRVTATPVRLEDGSTLWTGVALNTTAQHEASGELLRQKEMWQRAEAIAHLGWWELDLETDTLWWSDEVYRLFGYHPREFAATYDAFLEAIHPEDRDKVESVYYLSLKDGSDSYQVDHRIINQKTGAIRHVHEECDHIRNEQGDVVRSVGVVQDITESKLAQQALEQSERSFRQIFERSRAVKLVLDPVERVIVDANDAAVRFYGFPKETLIGLEISSIEVSSQVKQQTRHKQVFKLTGNMFTEEHRLASGETRFVEVLPSTVETNEGTMLYCIINDITERQQALEQLKTSEEKHRRLFETMAQGVVYQRADGEIISANPAAERILGLTFDQMRGRTSMHPDWRSIREDGTPLEGSDHPAMVALRTKQPERGIMGVFNPRKKGVTWIDVNAIPLFEEGEQDPYQVYGAFDDITDRVERERDRLELERRILEAQRTESLSTLAGGIAHDFNNLLVGVLGNAELLKMDFKPTSPEYSALEEISNSADRAAELARQMLAYSGQGRFMVEPVEINEIVQDAVSMVETSLQADTTLKQELASELPPIEADSAQIQQVILNVLLNASEAIGDKPGIITLRTYIQHYDEDTLATNPIASNPDPGAYITLEIADTGPGIDVHDFSTIFEPFYSTRFTGRGLGLAAVSGIVRSHQGAVLVESKPGEGARFRILFPPQESEKTAPQKAHHQESSASTSTKILLVDDEVTVRSVGERMMQRLGREVLLAAGGKEAISVFQENQKDIAYVLLDLSMPMLAGDVVFRKLKQIDPDVPIVITSGYDETHVAEQIKGLDVAGVLRKPFSMDSLREVLADR